ncbi:hypothetical protein WNY37_05600 [Henriciella sp. AS95]|uniref:hypothetical protein n=1 Tax=Henriciella sp. AS95 TaxID=3135782 RepID=UPI00316DA279
MAISEAQKVSRSTSRFQDRTGKWMFAVFAVVGALTISAIEVTEFNKLYSMSICVALLLAYAMGTYFIPSMRARADQIGDNVYYLGLLYTLMSLAAAIIRLSNDPNAADAILRNFGVALVTTIVGLMLRVVISQMRDDPADVERETRASLLSLSRSFRTELEHSARELRNFQVGLKQSVDEAIESTLARTTEAMEKTLDQHKRTVEALDMDEDSFVGPVQAAMDKLNAAFERHADELDKQSDRIKQAMDGTEKLGEQAEKFDAVSSNLSKAAHDLKDSLGNIAALGTATESMTAAIAGLSEDSEKARTSIVALGETAQSRLDHAFDQIDQRNKKDLSEVSDILSSIKKTVGELDAVSEKFMNSGNLFAERMAESEKSVAKVRSDLADMAEYIVKRIEKA